MTNEQQERHKRFEERFYEGDRNSVHCRKHKTYATPSEVLSFLDEEVAIAVANREKEIVETIKRIKTITFRKEDIINLISKNK